MPHSFTYASLSVKKDKETSPFAKHSNARWAYLQPGIASTRYNRRGLSVRERESILSTVIEEILATGIVAIARLEHYEQAIEITRALLAGGISVIEFSLTGRGAFDAIARVRESFGETAKIGVGTVLDAQTATEAMAAGAQFVVTPVVGIDTIEACKARDIPILCGALTPTEALTAHRAGADMIKIFPARLGGPQYIHDLLAPLPQLRLVPTGGIGLENIGAYRKAGAVAAGVGGNLLPAQAIAAGDWAHITAMARSYIEASK